MMAILIAAQLSAVDLGMNAYGACIETAVKAKTNPSSIELEPLVAEVETACATQRIELLKMAAGSAGAEQRLRMMTTLKVASLLNEGRPVKIEKTQ